MANQVSRLVDQTKDEGGAKAQIDIIIADLELFTRQEVIALALDMAANLQDEPAIRGGTGTPVDTGWASANWIPSITEPKLLESDTKNPTAQQVAARLQQSQQGLSDVLAWVPEDGPIFVANNVPYIGALNNGHSGQAPVGFVQDALEKAVRDADAVGPRKAAFQRRAAAYVASGGRPPKRTAK